MITYTHNGETHTVAEWVKITGLTKNAVRRHIQLGLPMERLYTGHGRLYNDDWWKLVEAQGTDTSYDRIDPEFDVNEYARKHGYSADE